MKDRASIVRLLTPWSGLVVGLVAMIVVHQFGSQGTFDDCRSVAPGPVLIIGLAGLALCLLSVLLSWRNRDRAAQQAGHIIAIISAGTALFFSFAIILAMIAVLLLPPCFG